jgi:hypothetical protein
MTITVLSVLASTVIALIGGIILIAVTFSRTLRNALDHADRIHTRQTEHVSAILDRLMAKNLDEYKAYELAGNGEIIMPEPVERPWNVPGQVAPGRALAGGDLPIGEEESEVS